jgi:LCP family protein required for cell wall assembly
VVVGSDSRSAKPDGQDYYGDGGTNGGERADVIIVVQVVDGVGRGFSVPRDLLVARSDDDRSERIASALQDGGVTELVGSLCSGLGVPTDHLVQVTMKAFVETVDALGGIDVDFAYPTRDKYSHLQVDQPGSIRLDGIEALKYVRSRHPEYLVDGRWRETDASQGNLDRAHHAGTALQAIAGQARAALRDPVRIQRVATAISTGVTLDRSAALWSLPTVANALRGEIAALPVQATDTFMEMVPNDATYQRLAEFGYAPGLCVVEPTPH